MLVASMSAVGPVSIDMYLPGFPAIEREFATRGVEGTMASFIVGIAIGQLFYGPISDRFGRKPPLYVGFVLYILGGIGCALSTSMTMLTAMRIVQGLGGCAGMVIGRAIVRDRCEPHEAARAFSTLMLIVALGPVVAPAGGGLVIAWLGWRATFVFQTLFGALLLFAVHRFLEESLANGTVAPLNIGNVLRTYARLVRDRILLGYSLVMGFSMGSMFCYVTGAPTVLTSHYGLTPQQFGGLIGLNGLAFMTASRLNMVSLRTQQPYEILARFIWVPPLLGIGLLLMSSLFDPRLWMVAALQLSFFVAVGRVNPNASAIALAPHARDAGAASALMGAVQSAITTLAGLAVAIFNDGTVRTLAAIMGTGAVLAFVSYRWARKDQPLVATGARSQHEAD
jgi:MFS transporter, DHA1 family, multidrug resistance protein